MDNSWLYDFDEQDNTQDTRTDEEIELDRIEEDHQDYRQTIESIRPY